MIHGSTHYFYGHFPVRKLFVSTNQYQPSLPQASCFRARFISRCPVMTTAFLNNTEVLHREPQRWRRSVLETEHLVAMLGGN
jgi:hypothetical protein